VAVGWTATIVGGGTYTVTAVNYQHPFNKITLSDGSLTMGYRIGINFSKSSKLWEFNSNGTLIGLPVGLISGSSQLTSSFDGRYTLTSSFNSFTASYFTDSASVDTRITTEKGRIDAILSASSADKDSFAEIVTLINSVDTTNDNAFASFYTSSNSRISSLENATSSYETKGSGIISGSSQLSGTTIPNLSGSFTGSFRGNVTGLASQASLVLTQNSNLNQDYSLIFAASGSNGYMQTYTDGVPGVLYNPSTNRLKSAYLQGEIEATNGVISGSSQLTSSFDTRYTLSGSVQPLPSGIISGSSQLTSSYDTRYTLSGSVQPLPAGLISGSSQLTSSFATTGSNSFSGSQTITGSLIVSAIAVVSGGINVPTGSVLSLTSGSSISIDSSGAITGSLTGSVFGIGNVVAFSSSVDSRLLNLQLASASLNAYTTSNDSWKDGVTNDISAINGVLSSLNNTYATDVEVAAGYEAKGRGIISGSSQLTSSYDTRYTLSGSISAVPSGTISGSSQLTASFDTRYAASGSGGSLPSGVISGSSQLTSSFDGRYLVTGSVTSSILQLNTFTASNANTSLNTFTSSLNIWSSSLATTGSNSFNGTQTITGSLIITTGSFLASQILANTSSLYLTSGSNLYVQNNGLTEITGSLRLSGSLAMSGSISISSGSITMPNRPAFRVYGLGGATTAITTLSGSMTIVDYNQGGWDNTTGTFTAPIAGLYQVNLVCRTNSNNSAQSVQVIVYKNNTTTSPSPNGTAQVMVEWAANTNVNHIGASTISKLAVGDTLKAIVTVGTASFDVNDNFSVAYIG